MPPPSPPPSPSQTRPVTPEGKRLLAVLTTAPVWEARLCSALEEVFGPIDYRGSFLPFEGDTYYSAEMGGPLWRGWLSFWGLADPVNLPAWKRTVRALEEQFRQEGRRTYNLDIGYMDADKLVLASFKRGPFKFYLGGEVWGDIVLGYSQGCFRPTPWAFPDFRDGRYEKSLGVIREKLKAEMRR